MKKYKQMLITWLLATLILVKELLIYIKIDNVSNFSYFVRDYFNYVYIKSGDREELSINRFFIVFVFYFLVYYTFYSIIFINIESFKNIIKYNSKSIIDYYKKGIVFFSKIFIKMATINLLLVLIIFRMFYDGSNYEQGVIDLIKLPACIYLLILIGIIFNIKKSLLASFMFLIIQIYILYLNKLSIIYFCLVYLIMFLIFITRLLFNKIDI